MKSWEQIIKEATESGQPLVSYLEENYFLPNRRDPAKIKRLKEKVAFVNKYQTAFEKQKTVEEQKEIAELARKELNYSPKTNSFDIWWSLYKVYSSLDKINQKNYD